VTYITLFQSRPPYLFGQQSLSGLEETMLVRKLAAAAGEVLVLSIGAAIAAPYVLVLVSPFILGH